MQNNRVVMIRYRYPEEGGRRIGSGLYTGGNCVLTADHVAAGIDYTVLTEFGEYPARVLLRSPDPAVDLAVLETDIPSEVQLPLLKYVRVNRGEVGILEGCAAIGFPDFIVDKNRLRRSAHIEGAVSTAEGYIARPGAGISAGYLSLKSGLQIPTWPPVPGGDLDGTPWAGMSGAVVFTADDRVLGVVRHHNPAEGSGTLALTPVDAIDLLPAPTRNRFWETLGVADPDRLPRLPSRQLNGLAKLGKLRKYQERLLADYEVVAGREFELTSLDEFLSQSERRYCLLTSAPGMGKTALLAEWIRRLEDRREIRTVYYFLSRSHGTAGREQDFLRSLLLQALWAWESTESGGGSIRRMEAKWLEILDATNPPPQPVVIVIDGIDEITGWNLRRLLLPKELPANVHFVISARQIANVKWPLELGIRKSKLMSLSTLDRESIGAVARQIGAPDWLLTNDGAAVLFDRTQGDPIYVRLLCDLALNGEIRTKEELAHHHKGLDEALEAWWQELHKVTPEAPVECLLSYLTAARAPITRAELLGIDANDALTWATFDEALGKVRRYVTGDKTDIGLAFSHWRIKEYFVKVVGRESRDKLVAWCDRWPDHNSRYALANGFSHHLELFKETNHIARDPARKQLLRLICDREYQSARVNKADDTAGLIADCGLLVAALATEPEVSVSDLVEASLEQSHVRSRWLRPEFVFSPATLGRYDEAVSRMSVLSGNENWRSAASMCLAWMAALSRETESAKQLLPGSIPDDSALRLLASRVLAAIDPTAPQPSLNLPYAPGRLPEASYLAVANEALERFGSSSAEGVVYSGLAPLYARGIETPTYLTEEDAPLIVAAARDYPMEGNDLLEQYIDLHSANPYASYRDRSLWTILGAVLCLPESGQALRHAVHLCEGAFAPSPVRFAEALQLSAHARQSAAALAEMRDHAVSEAAGLRPSASAAVGASGDVGSPSDRWAHHRRRLAAHAELIAHSDPAKAASLLDQVAKLAHGFAGYEAPATLTIAESNFIVRPGDEAARRDCLAAALEVSHNIQDPAFAARITSQVNAMIRLWENPVDDIAATVSRFVSHPHDAEFAAVHMVGEQFAHRNPLNHLPADKVTVATTLESLAQQVFQVPVFTVELLNPGTARNRTLNTETAVRIPDPTFVPLVATWLSACLLGSHLAVDRKVSLIASLVPAASSNPTLLDTLLARLVRVAPNLDLGYIEAVSSKAQTVEPTDVFEFGLS